MTYIPAPSDFPWLVVLYGIGLCVWFGVTLAIADRRMREKADRLVFGEDDDE